MKRQPAEPIVQLWLATAHLTAAIIASAIAITHAIAVSYHLRRLDADDEAETAEHVDAFVRGHR